MWKLKHFIGQENQFLQHDNSMKSMRMRRWHSLGSKGEKIHNNEENLTRF